MKFKCNVFYEMSYASYNTKTQPKAKNQEPKAKNQKAKAKSQKQITKNMQIRDFGSKKENCPRLNNKKTKNKTNKKICHPFAVVVLSSGTKSDAVKVCCKSSGTKSDALKCGEKVAVPNRMLSSQKYSGFEFMMQK